LKCELISI
jgi:hypothetical protein